MKRYLELKYSEQTDKPAVLGVTYNYVRDEFSFFVNTKEIVTLHSSQLGIGKQNKLRDVLLRIVDLAVKMA